MWIWIANKFAKFYAKRLNRSENILKGFFGGLLFLKHPVLENLVWSLDGNLLPITSQSWKEVVDSVLNCYHLHASDALDRKNGRNWWDINNLIVTLKVETVGNVYFRLIRCWLTCRRGRETSLFLVPSQVFVCHTVNTELYWFCYSIYS